MPFAGIGLDFIEGKKTYNLIKEYGFPKDKLLFAGLINGKNIWKNHYEETLKILSSLTHGISLMQYMGKCKYFFLLHHPSYTTPVSFSTQ